MRKAASACQAQGLQPVDTLVLSPDAAFLGAFWVGDLALMGPRPDIVERPALPYEGGDEERYLAFLADMAARAGE